MSATDELRAAATKLRGLSGMASRGRWHIEANRPTDEGQSHTVRPYYPGTREPAWFKVADGCTIMDANFVAAMNPTVALALADLLDAHESDWDEGPDDCCGPDDVCFECARNKAVLTLARAVNGSTP